MSSNGEYIYRNERAKSSDCNMNHERFLSNSKECQMKKKRPEHFIHSDDEFLTQLFMDGAQERPPLFFYHTYLTYTILASKYRT